MSARSILCVCATVPASQWAPLRERCRPAARRSHSSFWQQMPSHMCVASGRRSLCELCRTAAMLSLRVVNVNALWDSSKLARSNKVDVNKNYLRRIIQEATHVEGACACSVITQVYW